MIYICLSSENNQYFTGDYITVAVNSQKFLFNKNNLTSILVSLLLKLNREFYLVK